MSSPYADPYVAGLYARLAEPAQFAAPARDLVSLLDIAPGHLVLDVGTGAGIVAATARRVMGGSGSVVGVDRSIEMLRATDRCRSHARVVADVPGLPFENGLFDRVAASFVVSHFRNHEQGLADMVRVCRPSGRVGITAWGPLSNAAGELWSAIALKFVPADIFRTEFRAEIPWDDWFSDPAHLKDALAKAGLASIAVTEREYRYALPTATYLEVREVSVQGSILRRLLDTTQWDALRKEMTSEFRRTFPRTVEWVRDVHFAVGERQ